MQALILAAGCGRRLRPLTDSIPKALVEINGVPLLCNALDCISGRGVAEVVLVVGDKKELIVQRVGHQYKGMKITYVENPLYNETNNVYSLWLARNYIHDDLIMLECDLFYGRPLIDSALSGNAECNILVSPFNAETMDGTVVNVAQDMIVDALIIKRFQTEGVDYSQMYKTVNIYTFTQDFFCNKFMPAIDTYIATQGANSYYELVLGSLVYFGNNNIKAINVDEDDWSEIDNLEDLKRVEHKLCNNTSHSDI